MSDGHVPRIPGRRMCFLHHNPSWEMRAFAPLRERFPLHLQKYDGGGVNKLRADAVLGQAISGANTEKAASAVRAFPSRRK